MNKTWLIIRYEFRQMVTGKSFIILTLLFPLIGFVILGINQLVAATGGAEPPKPPVIGYVDQAGGFIGTESSGITLVPYAGPDSATAGLTGGDIDEFFVIPADYLDTGRITRFTEAKELEVPGTTYNAIRTFLLDNLLRGSASPEVTERVKSPLGIASIRLDQSGQPATDQGGFASFIVPMLFGFLLVMAIGSSSGTLVQGMGEEKQNRIMEVLLSSVSTRQLLLGKVLGLGGAGMLQILIWLSSLLIIMRVASSSIGGFFATVQIPENIIVLGLVYFILGYLFFSIMQAGLGAIVPNAKDSPQIAVAFILPAILPFYVGILFLRDHPDHFIGTVFTLFPITAPMSVFVRLGLSEIPAWELAASIAILVLSIVGALILTAKTFRVFLLMYGKTPSFKEVLRLIKEA